MWFHIFHSKCPRPSLPIAFRRNLHTMHRCTTAPDWIRDVRAEYRPPLCLDQSAQVRPLVYSFYFPASFFCWKSIPSISLRYLLPKKQACILRSECSIHLLYGNWLQFDTGRVDPLTFIHFQKSNKQLASGVLQREWPLLCAFNIWWNRILFHHDTLLT